MGGWRKRHHCRSFQRIGSLDSFHTSAKIVCDSCTASIFSFGMGLGYFYLWCHKPYGCDHYDGFYESPLYLYTKSQLEKTGQLEENLRVKVQHFYPQAEE